MKCLLRLFRKTFPTHLPKLPLILPFGSASSYGLLKEEKMSVIDSTTELGFSRAYRKDVPNLFKQHVQEIKRLEEGDKFVFNYDGTLSREKTYPLLRSIYSYSQTLFSAEKQNSRNLANLSLAMDETIHYYQFKYLSKKETGLFTTLQDYAQYLPILAKTYAGEGKLKNEQLVQDTIKKADILHGKLCTNYNFKQSVSIHEFVFFKHEEYCSEYKAALGHKKDQEAKRINLFFIKKFSELFTVDEEDLDNFLNTQPSKGLLPWQKKRLRLIQLFFNHVRLIKNPVQKAYMLSKLTIDLLTLDGDNLWANRRDLHQNIKSFEALLTKILALSNDPNSTYTEQKLLEEYGFPAELLY